MGLVEFRTKVHEYRRAAGIPQKQLAREMGLSPTVLSHKLHNSDDMRLTHQEVKRIVILLAHWQAIGTRTEAEQLLQLMELKPTVFTAQEWQTAPLSTLEATPAVAVSLPPQSNTPSQIFTLPAITTSLLGRDDLLATLRQRLADTSIRLLTLTGPGGVGKTRLAVALAHQMIGTYRDGVLFVPLASLSDPQFVASEIAHTLGLTLDSQQSPADQLKEYFAGRHLLLILDNFEQVMGAAPLISDLLGAAPQLCIVVTSRTVLNSYGEHQVRVPPLPLPNPQQSVELEALAVQPAVALFVARTQAVRGDFALTETNANHIAEICVRLDGLPLALELAAARCRLFSPKALLQRLDQPLALLSSTSNAVSARQRTLRDTIAWSYHLLHDMEQQLFTFISLFPGGCTADAAEVIFADQPPIGLDGALDVVSSLLDKSLLYQHEGQDHQVRFLMLETLREYAIEQISDSGTIDDFRLLQLHYYRHLVHEVAPRLSTDQQIETANLLETEHDNLRAVLAWALAHQPAEALHLCGDLWYFWFVRGYTAEGYAWMTRALLLPITDDASVEDQTEYSKALHGAGSMAYGLGNYDQAIAHLEAALAIRRQQNDTSGMMGTLNNLGNVAWDRSDLDQAQAYYEEVIRLAQLTNNKRYLANASNNLGSLLWQRDHLDAAQRHLQQALATWRELHNKQGLSQVLSNLGMIAVKQHHFDRALVLYSESLALARELGDRQSISTSLNNIGEVALHKGDYVQAQTYFEEALQIKRDINYAWGISTSLCNLGSALLFQGEFGRAIAALQEALTIMRGLGDRAKLANTLELLGVAHTRLGDADGALPYHYEATILSSELDDQQGMALGVASVAAALAVRGEWSTAIRWWGAADAYWERTHSLLLPAQVKRFSDELEAVRTRLAPDEFAVLWQTGRQMDISAAIQEALSVSSPHLQG